MAETWVKVRRYPMLMFAAHVDWQHMQLGILNRLSVLAAETHHTIYIFSGYRSDKYSAAHGGFAGDPHTYGIAADARVDAVNGPAIGSFYSVKTLAKYGLRSGNVPGFYQGKPDPSHVDLIGFGYDKTGTVTGKITAQTPAQASAADTQVGAQAPTATPSVAPPQTGPDPGLTQPAQLLPGTVPGNQSPIGAGSFWKRILEQPSVSPDTQTYASLYA